MNLQSLVERARSLSGIRLDSIRSDDEIEQLINETYQEILGIYPWPFLRGESTIQLDAGQDDVPVPTNFRYITSVVYRQGNLHKKLAQTTLDEIDKLREDEGEPSLYARVDDRNLKIWYAPDKDCTIEVRGQVEFANLSSPTDQPVFAEQFHPMISYRAAARLLAEEGDDSNRSQSYQLDSAGYLSRMEQYYLGAGNISLIRMGSNRSGR